MAAAMPSVPRPYRRVPSRHTATSWAGGTRVSRVSSSASDSPLAAHTAATSTPAPPIPSRMVRTDAADEPVPSPRSSSPPWPSALPWRWPGINPRAPRFGVICQDTGACGPGPDGRPGGTGGETLREVTHAKARRHRASGRSSSSPASWSVGSIFERSSCQPAVGRCAAPVRHGVAPRARPGAVLQDRDAAWALLSLATFALSFAMPAARRGPGRASPGVIGVGVMIWTAAFFIPLVTKTEANAAPALPARRSPGTRCSSCTGGFCGRRSRSAAGWPPACAGARVAMKNRAPKPTSAGRPAPGYLLGLRRGHDGPTP